MPRASSKSQAASSTKRAPYPLPKPTTLCKCPLCLIEDPNGITWKDKRTVITHKQNHNITALNRLIASSTSSRLANDAESISTSPSQTRAEISKLSQSPAGPRVDPDASTKPNQTSAVPTDEHSATEWPSFSDSRRLELTTS
ncbi:hypothetical protein AURDEDRAFT_172732 [Auricularia subglabra TFB-10046 SS5]|nr:hypothetical protein AURDEDRAFT_172732 [Auricularia subglabra TFB-10046 SS5]